MVKASRFLFCFTFIETNDASIISLDLVVFTFGEETCILHLNNVLWMLLSLRLPQSFFHMYLLHKSILVCAFEPIEKLALLNWLERLLELTVVQSATSLLTLFLVLGFWFVLFFPLLELSDFLVKEFLFLLTFYLFLSTLFLWHLLRDCNIDSLCCQLREQMPHFL